MAIYVRAKGGVYIPQKYLSPIEGKPLISPTSKNIRIKTQN
jgi:hypothetical protein